MTEKTNQYNVVFENSDGTRYYVGYQDAKSFQNDVTTLNAIATPYAVGITSEEATSLCFKAPTESFHRHILNSRSSSHELVNLMIADSFQSR